MRDFSLTLLFPATVEGRWASTRYTAVEVIEMARRHRAAPSLRTWRHDLGGTELQIRFVLRRDADERALLDSFRRAYGTPGLRVWVPPSTGTP